MPVSSQDYYRRDGSQIRLEQLLKRGGEGAVFTLSDPRMVAKIYHRPVDRTRTRKIEQMSQCQTEALLKFSAWPVEPLYEKGGKKLVGLLMRKVVDCREVHELYSPKSRRTYFPEANWRFLVHVAANIARAFAVLHSHSCVIGDVNQGNVLVSKGGTSFLIDCDSFQFQRSGTVFPCEVGVPTYTPPELQGKSFNGIVRSENHDNFGLAVMIFHLLFMGRHPFAGKFSGKGEMPIERAIEEYRFAFSLRAAGLQMAPPPNSLNLGGVPPLIADYFERAFQPRSTSAGTRPSAQDWCLALEATGRELRVCTLNPNHQYFGNAGCPWCSLERAAGLIFFGLRLNIDGRNFNIAAIWGQISSIPRVGPAPPLVSAESLRNGLRPSEEVQSVGRRRRVRFFAAWAFVVATLIILIVASVPGGVGFWIFVVSIFIGTRIGHFDDNGLRQRTKARFNTAQARRESIEERWAREATHSRYEACLARLSEVRHEYLALDSVRQQKLAQLQKDRRASQLRKFLERQFIRPGQIQGIGAGRVATLASYGIETAYDVTRSALGNVPGFGHVLIGNLQVWRNSVESRFVFDPNKGVDPDDIRSIEQEIVARKAHLEKTLISGVSELRQLNAQIDLARQTLSVEFKEALLEEIQADVNNRAA